MDWEVWKILFCFLISIYTFFAHFQTFEENISIYTGIYTNQTLQYQVLSFIGLYNPIEN